MDEMFNPKITGFEAFLPAFRAKFFLSSTATSLTIHRVWLLGYVDIRRPSVLRFQFHSRWTVKREHFHGE